jgi:hypothetical protein
MFRTTRRHPIRPTRTNDVSRPHFKLSNHKKKHPQPSLQFPVSVPVHRNASTTPHPRIMSTTTATTTASSQDQRWSDVVPPESALTFAAIYDPDEGLITLSHADIAAFEAETKSVDSPSDASVGNCSSQVLSFDQRTLGPSSPMTTTTTTGNNTAIKAYFRDAQPFRLPVTPRHQQHQQQQNQHAHAHTADARESSTLDGLDVYTQEVTVPGRSSARYWSIFHRLDKSPMFNPQNAFLAFRKSRDATAQGDIEDEGFFEGGTFHYEGEHNLVRPY